MIQFDSYFFKWVETAGWSPQMVVIVEKSESFVQIHYHGLNDREITS